MWKIERTISKGEYMYAVVPGHPNATKHGYVLEHRVVMENHLGRLLGPNELVHHLNGDRKDNSLKNLQVMSREEHTRTHHRRREVGRFKCPQCGTVFVRGMADTRDKMGRGKLIFCGRSCAGKWNSSRQLRGKVQGNLLSTYLE